MAVREWLSSTTDYLKRKSPDLTPVTETCWKGYDISKNTTVHVTRVVSNKARDLHSCLSDDQLRGDVTRVAKNLSFNGALFFVRSYGGGPIIDIVSRSLHDGKTDSQKERLKELEAKVAKLEKELITKKTYEHSEIPLGTVSSKSQSNELVQANSTGYQKPENVLHNFMMHEFVGTKLFNNLIIPGAGQGRARSLNNPSTSVDLFVFRKPPLK